MARRTKKSNRTRTSRPADLSEFSHELQYGIRAFEQGNLQLAADTASAILSRKPEHPDALHLLGLTAVQSGNPERAISLIADAILLSPRNAVFHKNLGDTQRIYGDLESAETNLSKAVKLKSDFVDAWISLGMVKHQLNRYEESVAAFEKALRFRPDSPDIYNNLGIAKRSIDKLSDALHCFEEAIRLQPDHAEAHNNLGSTLLDLHDHEMERINQVVQSYRAALQSDNEHAGLRRNLSYLYRRIVPQWHFPMLNDADRNDAYDKALRAVVGEDQLVLDIGTGSGLLAMMAARAGAKRVIGCEVVESIAGKAKEIVAVNGFEDRVTVINKSSDSLRLGEDLPHPADVLVAEVFDVGLIGEGALRSIHQAKQTLLKPNATIIPRLAVMYGVLVESESIRDLDHVHKASEFDVSSFNEFSTHPAYLQERLNAYPHRCLSEPFEVFRFDFQADIPFNRSRTIPVRVTSSGTIHFVALWFDLHLSDEIVFSTAPTDRDSHWQQAICFLETPQTVSEGATCSMTATHDERTIDLDIDDRASNG